MITTFVPIWVKMAQSHHVKSLNEHNTLKHESTGCIFFVRFNHLKVLVITAIWQYNRFTERLRAPYECISSCPSRMMQDAQNRQKYQTTGNEDQQTADALSAPVFSIWYPV